MSRRLDRHEDPPSATYVMPALIVAVGRRRDQSGRFVVIALGSTAGNNLSDGAAAGCHRGQDNSRLRRGTDDRIHAELSVRPGHGGHRRRSH